MSEVEEVKVDQHLSLQTELASKLADSGPNVRQMVVNDLVNVELNVRAGLVKLAIAKIDANNKEIKKQEKQGKPLGYSIDGKPTGESVFTKEQIEAIKKLRDENTKIQEALTKAFEGNDFSKLKEFGQKKEEKKEA